MGFKKGISRAEIAKRQKSAFFMPFRVFFRGFYPKKTLF
jgi:hypothetical protein